MSGPTPQMIEQAEQRKALVLTSQVGVLRARVASGFGLDGDAPLDAAIHALMVGSHSTRDGWAR